MLPHTITTVRAIVSVDPTMSEAEKVSRMEGFMAPPVPHPSEAERPDKVISCEEAAQMLRRTTRSIHHLAKAGILPRVVLPGRGRGAGFRLSDVQALISGKRGDA